MCLTRVVLFCCTTQHSRLKATVLSARLHKADYRADAETWFAWEPLLYHMQILESLVSGDNPGFWHVYGEKHYSSCLFSTACTNRAKHNCTLLRPLKGWIGPITGTIKPFYEGFYWLIWRSCTTCTFWPIWLLAALGLPHPSLSLSACLSPHRPVRQGSSSVKVSPPRCRSLPPQTPCRALRCGWWSSGSHKEASRHSGPLHWR